MTGEIWLTGVVSFVVAICIAIIVPGWSFARRLALQVLLTLPIVLLLSIAEGVGKK